MTTGDNISSPPKKKRCFRRWLIAFFALVIVALVGGELFARYYLGLGDPALLRPDPQIEYLFKPDQYCHRFGRIIKYNHYSMRSDDFPPQKTLPNELRVMVIGDSVINGGSLTDQSELATTILQQRLTEDLKRPVIVGNISAGSWGPPNELAYLKRYGLLDADVLVIVLSSHDYVDAPTFEPTVDVDPSAPGHKPFSALWEGFDRYFLPRIFGHVYMANEGPVAPTPTTTIVNLADLDWCSRSLHEMIHVGRQHHAKVLVALNLERAETLKNPLPGHPVLAGICKEEGIVPIEFGVAQAAARERGEVIYRDTIHPNAAGQKIMANILLSAIEQAETSGKATTSVAATMPATRQAQ